jgi:PBP1b-binding outer membrane lipoprotein LpoB
MKKVALSLVAVALFGTMALSSCKSGNTEAADSVTTEVEAPAPAVADTAVADTTAVDTAVVK